MKSNGDPAPPSSRLDRLTLAGGYLTLVIAATFAPMLAVQSRWAPLAVFVGAALVAVFGMWRVRVDHAQVHEERRWAATLLGDANEKGVQTVHTLRYSPSESPSPSAVRP